MPRSPALLKPRYDEAATPQEKPAVKVVALFKPEPEEIVLPAYQRMGREEYRAWQKSRQEEMLAANLAKQRAPFTADIRKQPQQVAHYTVEEALTVAEQARMQERRGSAFLVPKL